jgi:hypothetical protein
MVCDGVHVIGYGCDSEYRTEPKKVSRTDWFVVWALGIASFLTAGLVGLMAVGRFR